MPDPQKRSLIYLLALISMLFWGMSFVWTTIVFKYYNPITTIFLRLLISSVVLYSFVLLFKIREKIQKKDIKLFMISALFNPFLYFVGENFGLKFSSPTISAVIIATIPVFTPIAAYFTLGERLRWVNIGGIGISFTGVLVMLVNPDLTLNTDPRGAMLLMMAVIAAVIYTIFLKILSEKYSALTIIAFQNILGVLYFLPLFLIFDLDHFLTVKPTFELVYTLLFLAILASSLAFILFTIVIRNIGVSRANVFSNLIPVVTAIFSYIFISEIISPNKFSGIVLVISGVLLTQLGGMGRKKLN